MQAPLRSGVTMGPDEMSCDAKEEKNDRFQIFNGRYDHVAFRDPTNKLVCVFIP